MARSFLRYPGGKSKKSIQDTILSYAPSVVKEYREPFVGGGGIFFAISTDIPRWINDINEGLIEVYTALRDRPESFIAKCREIEPMKDGEEEVPTREIGKKYNKRLGEVFDSLKYNVDADQALRYLFINRTVWAGRVNYDPEFESRLYYSNPGGWGIVATNRLEEAAKILSGVKITRGDYTALLNEPGENVWIYLDPPYVVDTHFSRKSKLYEFGFAMTDHEMFVNEIKQCKHKVCISYDDCELVRDSFRPSDGFYVYEHTWKYCGSSQAKKKDGKELIITNYSKPTDHIL